MSNLSLIPVTSKNRRAAEELEVFPHQTGFIESVAECMKEADQLAAYRRLKEMGVEFLSEPQTFDSRIWIWQEPGSLSTGSGRDRAGAVADSLNGNALERR